MKSVVRQLVFNLVILWVLAGFVPEFSYSDFMGLSISAGLLTLIQIFIYPLISLLFTPINLITLGAIKWVPWLLSLVLFNWLSVFYVIKPVTIPSVKYGSLSLPTLHLGWISTIILFAFLYSLGHRLLNWLTEKED